MLIVYVLNGTLLRSLYKDAQNKTRILNHRLLNAYRYGRSNEPSWSIFELLHSNALSSISPLSSIDEKAVEAGFKPTLAGPPSLGVTIEALRLIKLYQLYFSCAQVSRSRLIYKDPVVSVYRTFGQVNHFNVSANLSVVNFPEAIAKHVTDTKSEMVIIPWPRASRRHVRSWGRIPAAGWDTQLLRRYLAQYDPGPNELWFTEYSEFIRNMFTESSSNITVGPPRYNQPSDPSTFPTILRWSERPPCPEFESLFSFANDDGLPRLVRLNKADYNWIAPWIRVGNKTKANLGWAGNLSL